MLARIYRPARSAMQSGRAKTQEWVLEFEPASARVADPLMGWISSDDMNGEVSLNFESKEQAVAYAQKHGIPFRVLEDAQAPMILKAYADNFAFHRKEPWTH
jgi:hypothetical protein